MGIVYFVQLTLEVPRMLEGLWAAGFQLGKIRRPLSLSPASETGARITSDRAVSAAGDRELEKLFKRQAASRA